MTKFIVMCGDSPQILAENKQFLASSRDATVFENAYQASQAATNTIEYAFKNGFSDSWGLCKYGYRIIPIEVEKC